MLAAAVIPVLLLVAQAPAAPAWQPVAPGVDRISLGAADAGLELLRFDLDRVDADVLVPGRERPLTAEEVRRETGALAVVNGGFFDTDGRSLGLRVASGRIANPLRGRVDWGVLVLRAHRATIIHSREWGAIAGSVAPSAVAGGDADARIVGAIQVGPRIVVDGEATRLKPQLARRTAIGVDAEGRHLVVAVSRWPTFGEHVAGLFVRLGLASAILLDGGPSTQLSAQIGDLRLDLPGGYGVPDLLVLRARRAP
jgi:hypothetical protein